MMTIEELQKALAAFPPTAQVVMEICKGSRVNLVPLSSAITLDVNTNEVALRVKLDK
jgi:hypothetical protein